MEEKFIIAIIGFLFAMSLPFFAIYSAYRKVEVDNKEEVNVSLFKEELIFYALKILTSLLFLLFLLSFAIVVLYGGISGIAPFLMIPFSILMIVFILYSALKMSIVINHFYVEIRRKIIWKIKNNVLIEDYRNNYKQIQLDSETLKVIQYKPFISDATKLPGEFYEKIVLIDKDLNKVELSETILNNCYELKEILLKNKNLIVVKKQVNYISA